MPKEGDGGCSSVWWFRHGDYAKKTLVQPPNESKMPCKRPQLSFGSDITGRLSRSHLQRRSLKHYPLLRLNISLKL